MAAVAQALAARFGPVKPHAEAAEERSFGKAWTRYFTCDAVSASHRFESVSEVVLADKIRSEGIEVERQPEFGFFFAC